MGHYNLASALQDMGQIDEAIVNFTRALEIDPTYVDAHFNLGIAFQDKGRYEDSHKCYANAVKLEPDFLEAKGAMKALRKVLEKRKKGKSGKENGARKGGAVSAGVKGVVEEKPVERTILGRVVGN